MTDKYDDYLSDGLYVGFDGYQIALKANHHQHPTDTVYLERGVFDALLRYAENTINWKTTEK